MTNEFMNAMKENVKLYTWIIKHIGQFIKQFEKISQKKTKMDQ